MERRIAIIVIGLAATAGLSSASLAAAAESGIKRPNFIFILTDDQGWSETSFQMDRNTPDSFCSYLETPNMRRLAEAGMRFTSGYAPAPICTPTRRSVLCGQTPARLRGTEFPTNPKDSFDPRDHPTIPKALKAIDASYLCAHFGKWGELIPDPRFAGYDVSDGETGNNTGGGMSKEDGSRKPVVAEQPDKDPKLICSMTKRATDFLERAVRETRPFFMQISHYAPHYQVRSRAETIEKYIKKGAPPRDFPPEFAAMLDDLDTGVGILLDKVKDLGLEDNTYIVLSSDNGGAPHEPQNELYQNMLHATGDTVPKPDARLPVNYPLRAAKQSLYEGGIRVPFIVRGPGVAAGSASDVPVVQYDLLPTFVDLAGGGEVVSKSIDGGSMRKVLENEGKGKVKRPLPGLVFHRPQRGYSAYREGNLKLVVDWRKNVHELYDLSQDLSEQKDLAKQMPEKAEQMHAILDRYLKDVNAEPYAELRRKRG